ncbi:FkbM family methyltransferase [Sphingomonas sp. ASY06-1R]|uniref:FkbM family methyltransferase n=1 Tax=Sphingomonas sp. ASY06-1R TaxID=3445771 RepID=UPI003FA210EA
MAYTSWSIQREDIMLLRALNNVHHDNGFYIDVGANHPTYDNDTKLFYDHGWKGINIEPSPHWFKLIQAERPRDTNIQAAASDVDGGTITLYDHPEGGLGTAHEVFADRHAVELGIAKHGVEVPRRTVASICERYIKDPHKQIQFMKIDVEGHEEQVIRGCDFKRFRPWILCVEAVEPLKVHVPTHEAWDHLLVEAGYQYTLFDGLNRWYVAEEHPERLPAFAYPTDDFLHWSYQKRIADLERKVRELEG